MLFRSVWDRRSGCPVDLNQPENRFSAIRVSAHWGDRHPALSDYHGGPHVRHGPRLSGSIHLIAMERVSPPDAVIASELTGEQCDASRVSTLGFTTSADLDHIAIIGVPELGSVACVGHLDLGQQFVVPVRRAWELTGSRPKMHPNRREDDGVERLGNSTT